MNAGKRIRVALVGCGQIADAHLGELRKIDVAETVGVCDSIPELAFQAARRFSVPNEFSDLEVMLERTKPDVVHITTPPQTHTQIAQKCFQHGCHVYVEKPFAVNEEDAVRLINAAENANCLVCPGHDQLYDPFWLRFRRLLDSGSLGEIVHVDAIQGYDLSGPFGRELAENSNHWVHRLPGGLLQNTIIHALYRIDDLLNEPDPNIHGYAYSFQDVASFRTELRATLVYSNATANLHFTSATKPTKRLIRVSGTRGTVELDFDTQILSRPITAQLPGALGKVEAPFRETLRAIASASRNAWSFTRSNLQYFGGMRHLFEQFYRAIQGQCEPPISNLDTLRLVRLTDQVVRSANVVDEIEDLSHQKS